MDRVGALLAGIWGKIAAGAAIVGGLLLVIGRLKKAGKDEARVEQEAATMAAQRRMQDAHDRGPHTGDDVDQRLRDGKF